MNIPVQNCSSCAACANVCTRNAISMLLDSEGFYRPIIDAEKCIECGACERACPWNKLVVNPNIVDNSPKTIAAYAKDETVRLQSSSGGIFTILAERILDDRGIVVGVAQTESTHFRHIVVDNKADLAKLRGSKYVQADVGFVYREVRSLLKAGHKVLFSGTPCQVAGLYTVLGNTAASANLFTVDIVCHGSELFDSISGKIAQRDSKIEYAIAGNPCIVRSSKPHPKRTEFFTNLDKYTFNDLIKIFQIHQSKISNLWNFLHLPNTRIRERLVSFFSSLKTKS